MFTCPKCGFHRETGAFCPQCGKGVAPPPDGGCCCAVIVIGAVLWLIGSLSIAVK